jgi:hypothetical protein
MHTGAVDQLYVNGIAICMLSRPSLDSSIKIKSMMHPPGNIFTKFRNNNNMSFMQRLLETEGGQ